MLPKAIVLKELTENLTEMIPVVDDFTDMEIFAPKIALEELIVDKIGLITGDLKVLDEGVVTQFLDNFPGPDAFMGGDFLEVAPTDLIKLPLKQAAIESLITEIDGLIWEIIPGIESQAVELKLALDQLLMEGIGISIAQLLDPLKEGEGVKEEEGLGLIADKIDIGLAKYELIKIPKQISTLKARNLVLKTTTDIFAKIGLIEAKIIELGEIVVTGEFDEALAFFREVDPMDVIQKLEDEVFGIIEEINCAFEAAYNEIADAVINLEEAVLSKLGVDIGLFNTAVEEVKLFFKYVTKVLPLDIKTRLPIPTLFTDRDD